MTNKQSIPDIEVSLTSWDEFVEAGGELPEDEFIDTVRLGLDDLIFGDEE